MTRTRGRRCRSACGCGCAWEPFGPANLQCGGPDYMVRAVPCKQAFHARIQPVPDHRIRAVRLWLLAVAAMIFMTLVVGGATRLTKSGLSITEWKPVTGVVPPLSHAAWEEEFKDYQAIPQYQELNRGMSLDQFKVIYWWEWTHRLLARATGFVFLLPFLFFLWRGGAEALARAAVDDLRRRRLSRRRRLVDGGVGARRLRPRQRVAIPACLSSDARLRDLCRRAVDRAADRAAAGERGAGAAARRRAGHRRPAAAANLSRRAGRRPRRRPRLQHLAADRRRVCPGGRASVVPAPGLAQSI